MILSPQQQQAVDAFNEWYKLPYKRRPHFYIGGYAGTGKSTIVRHILDNGPEELKERVLVLTPTGKAADVLRKKGVEQACTIHSAIYAPSSKHDFKIKQLRHALLENLYADEAEKLKIEEELGKLVKEGPSFSSGDTDLLQGLGLFIVDEFSMVGQRIYDDLVDVGIPVLAFGDPGQLPPVKDAKPLFSPDFTLTEIHRQAEGNPIIELAHMARNDGYVPLGDYGDSRVIDSSEYDSKMLLEHDQIICFTHKTRVKVNKRVRELMGHHSTYPLKGEKLVCKKNDAGMQIWNGAMYHLLDDAKEIKNENHEWVQIKIRNSEDRECNIPIYQLMFDSYVRNVREHEHLSWNEREGMATFDFGYAITCHSAQGSEWDSVLIIDESGIMRSEKARAEWLYTAITRAAKRVTVYKR